MKIKVFRPGCVNCINLVIMQNGIMYNPGVTSNDKLVSSGMGLSIKQVIDLINRNS